MLYHCKKICNKITGHSWLLNLISIHPLNISHFSSHTGVTNLSHDVTHRQKVLDAADALHGANPYSLILPNNSYTDSVSDGRELIEDVESCHQVLGSGMILLKNFLSITHQAEIVNKCQQLGVGPGGFYQPSFSSGSKMQLHMMCYGRNWDPQSMSYRRYRIGDGAEAPPVPDTFVSLVETTLQKTRSLLKKKDQFPLMSPDICIVNFYSATGRLGLHQDMDESRDSLKRGLPVVSISIGDSAEFLYGYTKDKQKATKVLLESGDILIFGGKNRHIYHGIQSIIPNSAPLSLLKETMLRPGRLNLTFRKY